MAATLCIAVVCTTSCTVDKDNRQPQTWCLTIRVACSLQHCKPIIV